MTAQAVEVVRGSFNVFRHLDLPNPDLEELRAILAARIIVLLDETGMSVRKAHEVTGLAASDFSRIRRANLGRFTVDRLIGMLHLLDQEVEVSVEMHPRTRLQSPAPRLFNRRAASYAEIANELSAREIPSAQGRLWHPASVWRHLQRPPRDVIPSVLKAL